MMFSTCAVSCTPGAAVGSSMITSFDAKAAVRAMDTLPLPARHVSDWVVDVGDFHSHGPKRLKRAVAHRFAVEPGKRAEAEFEQLAPHKQV